MENGDDLKPMEDLDDETLQVLYTWIDEIPLSRPKRNIARDFSDGVLVAEIVHNFIPKLVEIHNYSGANSISQKKDNWGTLQRKVLSRIEFKVSDDLIDGICKCRSGSIEVFLINLRNKIDKYIAKRKAAALRKHHQVYDEFSPAPVPDTNSYQQMNGGVGYGYDAFNTVPQQDMVESSYAMHTNHPEHYQAGPYNQLHSHTEFNQSNVPKPGPNVGNKREAVNEGKPSLAKRISHVGQQRHEKNHHQPKGSPQNIQLLLEEKEQSLLASQETVQILQVKVRRLEHLLHLKDIRIEDLTRRLQQATQPPPKHLPPQHNPPVPPISGAAGQPLPRMHSTPPLPPVRSPPKYGS
ncbi:sperm flagellar protein 1-like [Dendronephthya gigantea]|uniref:sperm flagellar protein 1-like n=1 Tax=Dendronephthya gigantea TaxID=151771 RepID=UPI00106CAF27|nr:sperm flagellar protein 1-like [Dendronephthya gigantea]